MTDTTASLLHKTQSAKDLQGVVRTMKAMAATSISQYENAVQALDDYNQNLQLALLACFKADTQFLISQAAAPIKKNAAVGVLVFGSDQGLVGQFNESMSDYVNTQLTNIPGEKKIWVLGERLESRLRESDLTISERFPLPNSIAAISPLVSRILLDLENSYERGDINEVYIYHHQPTGGASYRPVAQRLLPLDNNWQASIRQQSWPSKNIPEVIGGSHRALLGFIHEYLFITLFRACADSLASENASRLAAMQRAEKNIDELLEHMQRKYHQLRQAGIDEELFDLISGFEALQIKST